MAAAGEEDKIDKILKIIKENNEANLNVSKELSVSIAKIADFISAAAPAAPAGAAPPGAAGAKAAAPPGDAPPGAAGAKAADPPPVRPPIFKLSEYLLDWINNKSGYEIKVTKDQLDTWLDNEQSKTVIRTLLRANEEKVKPIVETQGKITKEIVEEIKKIVAGGRRLRIRKTKKKNRKSNKTRSRQKRL